VENDGVARESVVLDDLMAQPDLSAETTVIDETLHSAGDSLLG
jgi:hypothetical protein